jgi:Protein of unknown function (DUF551)
MKQDIDAYFRKMKVDYKKPLPLSLVIELMEGFANEQILTAPVKQQKGLQWVKASERKPIEGWKGVIKFSPTDYEASIFVDGKFKETEILGMTFIEQEELEWLSESPAEETKDGWISVDERLPALINKKCFPILVVNIENNKSVINKSYYFPEKFKPIEYEDLDDYDEESNPHTFNDTEEGVVWLRAGFYREIEDNEGNEFWSFPLKVTHWQPLPTLPTQTIE